MPQNNQTLLEKTVADQWQTLPSGLTVIVRPMPGYSSTHVIFATRFGSIDRDFRLDGKEVHLPAGVAHFLEHKMFEDQDGDAFAKYAKTGANANAFTSFDRTCYLFTATQQLDESLDVLLGMVTHPYFTEQTIAKEQGIIGQEIKMYDDSPDWRLITGLCECLYHSHPIRSDIAGTVESIAEITPGMLYDCCRAFYAPGNMVLAAAGNTTMEQILAACQFDPHCPDLFFEERGTLFDDIQLVYFCCKGFDHGFRDRIDHAHFQYAYFRQCFFDILIADAACDDADLRIVEFNNVERQAISFSGRGVGLHAESDVRRVLCDSIHTLLLCDMQFSGHRRHCHVLLDVLFIRDTIFFGSLAQLNDTAGM